MSEMIERVAKAMAEADAQNTAWKLYVREAEAAIRAMREPTAPMLFVGSNNEAGFTELNLLQSWQLMIDEALKP